MLVLNDFSTSVEKALSEIDPHWKDYDGVIICGTHSPDPTEVEMQIEIIKDARLSGKPFLGICFGHQLAAIEYARNVLGIENANTEELKDHYPVTHNIFVVYKLPQLNVGLKPVVLVNHGALYESFWNNYEVMPDISNRWEKAENFITCQYHPEYQSSKDQPHPLLVKFIELCKKK